MCFGFSRVGDVSGGGEDWNMGWEGEGEMVRGLWGFRIGVKGDFLITSFSTIPFCVLVAGISEPVM